MLQPIKTAHFQVHTFRELIISLLLRLDQKFCNRYQQFYNPINVQEIVAWRNSAISYLQS